MLQAAACNIPNAAQAYSLNFTAIPKNGGHLGFLSVWPAGQPRPIVSTLNAPTGTITANAAIVPAGAGGDGDIMAYASGDTDLVIDINGYFAAPSSAPNPLSLYAVQPCRALDTRPTAFAGQRAVGLTNGPCAVPAAAQAYVLNATVVPPAQLGFLTLWPDGGNRPTASTLNAQDAAITSNMAIVPSTNGSIDAYANSLTQLVLDISSYFAP